MLADRLEYVIGADPHRDRHALALVDAGSGARLREAAISADAQGYAQALALAERHAPGSRAWAIEGTGSYGKGLARYLEERGELVCEVERPKRSRGRGRGKSDPLDALRAARSLLGEEHPALPRAGGGREALRSMLVARASAVRARTAARNELKALVVTCPERLRAELQALTPAALVRRLRRLRPERRRDPEQRGTLLALRSLAQRIAELSREERLLRRELEALVAELAPCLLGEPGVGPVTGAQLLVSWSHKGRLRSEAAFARLAGAAPLPASSGQVVRHRLDRGGDRALNSALHQIVLSRRKHDPRTIAYVERRLQEGKSVREAIRCLKRYLARHLFRLLEAMPVAA